MADISITQGDTLEVTYSVSSDTGELDNILDITKNNTSQNLNDIDVKNVKKFTWSPTNSHVGNTYLFDINGETLNLNITNRIPDISDLNAWFDASDKTDVSVWENEVDEIDLTAINSPTIVNDAKNGNNIVRYDKEDWHTGNWINSPQSHPNHVFFVFRVRSSHYDNNEYMLGTPDGDSNGKRQDFFFRTNNNENRWSMYTSSGLSSSGGVDYNWHIASLLYNGSSSHLRIDGVEVASGSLDTASSTGLTISHIPWADNKYKSIIDVGELAFYPINKTDKESDIEQYLSSKWDIPLQ